MNNPHLQKKKRNESIVHNVFAISFFKVKKYFTFDSEAFSILWAGFYSSYCVKKSYEECFDKVWRLHIILLLNVCSLS